MTNIRTRSESPSGKHLLLSLLGAPYLPLLVSSCACLWLYGLNDSLWRDESKLLLNIIHKSFLGLAGHLDHGQAAPVLFLWIYRLIFVSGAHSALAFRAVSLVATICGIVIFHKLARTLIPDKSVALFIVWLYGLSPGVIFFSAQAKPYALDILVATILLWLASSTFFSSGASNRRVFLLALCGTIAPWLSLPAVFLVGPLILLVLLKARNSTYVRLGLCFVQGMSCLLASLLALSGSLSAGDTTLSSTYQVLSHRNNVEYVFTTLRDAILFVYTGFTPIPHITWALMALGLIGIVVSYKYFGWSLTFLLAAPAAIASLFSLADLYPVFGRVFLFVTPLLYVCIGFALVWLHRHIRYRGLIYVIYIMLLVPCVMIFWRYYRKPIGGVRTALHFIVNNEQPGTLVFSDPYSSSTVAYYLATNNRTATKLTFVNRPDKWIGLDVARGSFDTRVKKLLLPYDDRPICFLAETHGYARAGKGLHAHLDGFDETIVKYLSSSRRVTYSYKTSDVQAIGFAAVSGHPTPSQK